MCGSSDTGWEPKPHRESGEPRVRIAADVDAIRRNLDADLAKQRSRLALQTEVLPQCVGRLKTMEKITQIAFRSL